MCPHSRTTPHSVCQKRFCAPHPEPELCGWVLNPRPQNKSKLINSGQTCGRSFFFTLLPFPSAKPSWPVVCKCMYAQTVCQESFLHPQICGWCICIHVYVCVYMEALNLLFLPPPPEGHLFNKGKIHSLNDPLWWVFVGIFLVILNSFRGRVRAAVIVWMRVRVGLNVAAQFGEVWPNLGPNAGQPA